LECYNTEYKGVLKISGLAALSDNCKWYSSLPVGAVVSLVCESQSSEFWCHNTSCSFSTSVYCCKHVFCHQLGMETFGYTLIYV